MRKNFITYGRCQMIYILVPVLFLGFLVSCNSTSNKKLYTSFRGEVFGTTYSVNVASDSLLDIGDLSQKVDSLLDLIDLTFSTYSDSTLLSFFNHNYSDSGLFPKFSSNQRYRYANGLLVHCVEISKTVHSQTSGALDPTAGKMFNIWGFAEGEFTNVPDSQLINTALMTKGLNNITTFSDEDSIEKIGKIETDSALRLNFNAVAKGMAVDEVSNLLENFGITNYTVEIGGEMRIRGHKQHGEKWVIGINKPSRDARTSEAILYISIENNGLATSGNYRNYFEVNGKLYAHIIDPRIGYPAETDLLSATVFHPESGVADAYATAFMVLGSKRSIDIADSIGLEYIFIQSKEDQSSEYEVILSDEVKKWVVDP